MPALISGFAEINPAPRNPGTFRLTLESSRSIGKRRRIMIHGLTGRAVSVGPVRGKISGYYDVFAPDITVGKGDMLYFLDEKWSPSGCLAEGSSREFFKKNGWTWRDQEADSLEGVKMDSVLLSSAMYSKIVNYLEKESRTPGGAGYWKCIRTGNIPPFILDLFLSHHKDLYITKAEYIFKRNFDYRSVLSPFAKNILEMIGEKGFLRLKEIQRMKNIDAVLDSLYRLGLADCVGGLYLVPRDKTKEIPRIVKEARTKDSEISLNDLSDLTGYPKKVLLSILREVDEN